jgi:crotonobetainyl-CoA:carnitine CoA-transferase CaiB-like acyl-CoA transferase
MLSDLQAGLPDLGLVVAPIILTAVAVLEFLGPIAVQMALRHAGELPAGPINSLNEVFADPQVVARGMKLELDGIPTVRSPFVFSGAELALERASPKLGEHDEDVRAQLKDKGAA